MSQLKKFWIKQRIGPFGNDQICTHRPDPEIWKNVYLSVVDTESVLVQLKKAKEALTDECWCPGNTEGVTVKCNPCEVNLGLDSFIKELEK